VAEVYGETTPPSPVPHRRGERVGRASPPGRSDSGRSRTITRARARSPRLVGARPERSRSASAQHTPGTGVEVKLSQTPRCSVACGLPATLGTWDTATGSWMPRLRRSSRSCSGRRQIPNPTAFALRDSCGRSEVRRGFSARIRVVAELDADLAVPHRRPSRDRRLPNLFSSRIGCQVHQPIYGISLGALGRTQRPGAELRRPGEGGRPSSCSSDCVYGVTVNGRAPRTSARPTARRPRPRRAGGARSGPRTQAARRRPPYRVLTARWFVCVRDRLDGT